MVVVVGSEDFTVGSFWNVYCVGSIRSWVCWSRKTQGVGARVNCLWWGILDALILLS